MKTSNKLLLITTLIMFGYLVVYVYQLKAEYLKGDFRSRFYGMKYTDLGSFNKVEHRAGNMLSIQIEKGPKFGAWLRNGVADKVAFTTKNNALYIDLKDKNRMVYFESAIIITCPDLNSISTTPILNTEASLWSSARTYVRGFDQDSLSVTADQHSEIELNKNVLNKLNAATKASNATITVHNDNQIKSAAFNIQGKSDLKLFNNITNSSYNYTDSAAITLNGKVFRQFKQQ
ncbi:MAG TPA: hypothetical protein VL490_00220 [Mucilaginibacter sp.]|jgi:hypothetical protein|nr:hypothetical protein [Mucilaginibacter sp.]